MSDELWNEEDLQDDADFRLRVQELERQAAVNPERYRRKLMLWTASAFWFFPVLAAACLALLIWGVYRAYPFSDLDARSIKQMWLLALPAFGMVSLVPLMLARSKPYDGFEIKREEAPELFAMIDGVASTLKVDPPQHVYLDTTFNAAAVQRTDRLMGGKVTNSLILGAPYMRCLTADELKGVIAHEFGHFIGADGEAGWKIHKTQRLLMQAANSELGILNGVNFITKFLARFFLAAYMPRVFVFRRQNEYAADAVADRVAGRDARQSGISKVYTLGSLRSEVEAQFSDIGIVDITDKARAFEMFEARLAKHSSPQRIARHHRLAMHDVEHESDTHPSLAKRLGLSGHAVNPPVVDLDEARSISLLSPETVLEFEAHETNEWFDHFNEDETERRKSAMSWLKLRRDLKLQIENGSFNRLDLARYLRLETQFGGVESTLKAASQFVASHPTDANGLFLLGEYLADDIDLRAEEFLEAAVLADPLAKGAAMLRLADLAEALGQEEDALELRKDEVVWNRENEPTFKELRKIREDSRVRAVIDSYLLALGETIFKFNPRHVASVRLMQHVLPAYYPYISIFLVVEATPQGLKLSTQKFADKLLQSAANHGYHVPTDTRLTVFRIEAGEEWVLDLAKSVDKSVEEDAQGPWSLPHGPDLPQQAAEAA